jgi:hypothetical protein
LLFFSIDFLPLPLPQYRTQEGSMTEASRRKPATEDEPKAQATVPNADPTDQALPTDPTKALDAVVKELTSQVEQAAHGL